MAKEATQRRVYVLPTELVDRIVAFQTEKNLASEVEAVRRLLDEALLHRDTADTILKRLQARFQSIKLLSDVAKDVLVGHPLVENITFNKGTIVFSIRGYGTYSMTDAGNIYFKDGQNWVQWDDIPF